jgi:type II secretory pathway component PulF
MGSRRRMNIEAFFAKLSFTGQKKVRVLRQLQRLIAAGVPIARSLDMLYALYSKNGAKKKEPIAYILNDWRMKLKSGKSLATCMAGWISPTEQMIIDAGEQSEGLSTAFSDALLATSAAKSIRTAIIGGVAYPIVMMIALVGMLWGFSNSVVPTFATIVDPSDWTGNAAKMYTVSQFVTNWIFVLIIAVISSITVIIATMPYLLGPIRPYLDRVPPWSLYKVITGASFMISMRGFLVSGVTVTDALRRIMKNSKPYLMSRTDAIYRGVNMGRNIGVAMQSSGHDFPDPEISGEISIYAELDDFSENLDILAKEWIEGSIEKTQSASKLLSNIMLAALALTIGFIATTMFELQEIISKSAQN